MGFDFVVEEEQHQSEGCAGCSGMSVLTRVVLRGEVVRWIGGHGAEPKASGSASCPSVSSSTSTGTRETPEGRVPFGHRYDTRLGSALFLSGLGSPPFLVSRRVREQPCSELPPRRGGRSPCLAARCLPAVLIQAAGVLGGLSLGFITPC